MRWILGAIMLLLAVSLAACGGGNNESSDESADGGGDEAEAVEAIENYWNARVGLDEEALYQFSCAAREGQVAGEIQSLKSVTNLRLEGFSCSVAASDGGDMIVTCDGSIVGDYGTGDDTEFPLRSYRMTQEDGEWKMCGEVAEPEGS